jgi:low affinity Fe/Cu permease
MQNFETFALSSAARSTLIDVVKLGEKAGNQLVKAADQLIADGLSFANLETEKKGGSVIVRTEVKAALFQGLTKREQEIISADVKTLDLVQKTERDIAKNKIDSYLRKVRNHMMPEVEGEGETKTEVQRIQKLLEDAITKMQGLVEPAFDVVDLVKRIKSVKGAMPAV